MVTKSLQDHGELRIKNIHIFKNTAMVQKIPVLGVGLEGKVLGHSRGAESRKQEEKWQEELRTATMRRQWQRKAFFTSRWETSLVMKKALTPKQQT